MQLHCVRHGETPLNARGVFSGHGPEGLTETQEAELLGIEFEATSFDVIYSSPAFRCIETARCLRLPRPVEDARLAERHFGVFDGLSVDEARASYPDEFARFQELDRDFVIPGGESRAQHLARLRTWLREVGRFERVLAITHGGIIDFLYRLGTGAGLHGGGTVFAGPNAALSIFEVLGSELRVIQHGVPLSRRRGDGVPIDHLVFAAPDLETGMDVIESKLGVRPVAGGRHPSYGTHNALLALGPSTYLEVIAPDPRADRPARGRVFGLDEVRAPEMRTWAVRREDITSAAARAEASGIGPIESGGRQRPDGARLTWRLTDPYAMPYDGAVPFVISWGDTPHPAAGIPSGGSLVSLSIVHPAAEAVRSALGSLDLTVAVRQGDAFQLVARITTLDGALVELR